MRGSFDTSHPFILVGASSFPRASQVVFCHPVGHDTRARGTRGGGIGVKMCAFGRTGTLVPLTLHYATVRNFSASARTVEESAARVSTLSAIEGRENKRKQPRKQPGKPNMGAWRVYRNDAFFLLPITELLSSCVQKLTRHFSNFGFYFLIKLTPPRLPQKSWE